MTTGELSRVVAPATALSDAVSALLESPLTPLADHELLSLLREGEAARRRLELLDARLIAEVQQRNLPAKYSTRSVKTLLTEMLTVSPQEAGRRVRQAEVLTARIGFSGEALPPLLPASAVARADGTITSEHVAVIERAIDRLPATVPAAEVDKAEAFLVEQARVFHARSLVGIARQLRETLDPDGTCDDVEQQRRRRHLSLMPLSDGMYRLCAELDGETAALAHTVLHSLAAPRPDADGGERDERTGGQRLHDAFAAVLKLALRARQLPRSGGVPATVLITMTAEQYETRAGLVTTSFGQRLTVGQALRLADEASIGWIVRNGHGAVLRLGRKLRLATPSQTLALIARDQGCAFPGCDQPPEWTEKHHIIPWARGGGTDVDNLVLLCGFHHDRIDTSPHPTGWTIAMRGGLPWFIPPAWLDPEQKPRRNSRR